EFIVSDKESSIKEQTIRKKINKDYKVVASFSDYRNKPKSRIEKIIEKSSKQKKIDYLKKFASHEVGAYVAFDGRWDLIEELNNPKIALAWALIEIEPIDNRVLNILESSLDISKDPQERFKIAALVYRYGSNLGEDFLLSELNEGNKDAALILLKNNEDSATQGLINYIKNGSYDAEILRTLGSIKNKEMNDFLNNNLLDNFEKIRPRLDTMSAIRRGKQKLDTATEQKLNNFFKDEDVNGLKIETAATLLAASDYKNSEYSSFLLEKMKDYYSYSSSVDRGLLFIASSNLNSPQSFELSKKILNEYIQKEGFVGFDDFEQISLNNLLKNDSQNIDLIEKAVKKRAEWVVSNPPNKIDYKLVETLYDSGSPNAEILIEENYGRKYLEGFLTTKALNELPFEYLPVRTKDFIGR
ncbi:MAG: hypothetical protein ACRENO_00540, partial [Thermodesulfobacteriota bacterium]